MGEIQTKVPTEIQLTERREFELSEQGFIGLVFRKGSNNAAFFSANSAQKPKLLRQTRPRASVAETNYRLGTQLPYMFVIMPPVALPEGAAARADRFVEGARGSRARAQPVDRPVRRRHGEPRAGRALAPPAPQGEDHRGGRRGQPGWYKCGIQVRPHFKYMGASFTLSLVGKLDKT
jgi:type VI secretion system protein ImpC